MKKLILTTLLIFAFNIAKGQEIATTESGKKVMLFDDGTYKTISSKQNTTNISSQNSSSENRYPKVFNVPVQLKKELDVKEWLRAQMVDVINIKCVFY
jgi:hypothetical protein